MIFQDCTFEQIGVLSASSIIKSYHYLHTMPAGVMACYAMCKIGIGTPVAVSVFSNGRVQYDGILIELARLWVDDAYGTNAESYFMARSIRSIAKAYPTYKGIVSWSDPSQGHIGTIYKAANFCLDGRSRQNRMKRDIRTGRIVCERNQSANRHYTDNIMRAPKDRWVYWFDPKKREALKAGTPHDEA